MKIVNRKLLLLFILFFFSQLFVSKANGFSRLGKQYFLSIALGSEFGSQANVIRKWQQDMIIYVMADKSNNPSHQQRILILKQELTYILKELNSLISLSGIKLKLTKDQKKANYIIYFGSGRQYANNLEPNAIKHIAGNYGLFWCYWSAKYALIKGSMYVDIYRTPGEQFLKHLLREELTQSLGLMNDSFQFKDSIFYQGWTNTTSYTYFDKEVIKILYHPKIKSGMNAQQVKQVLKHLVQ